VDEVINTVEFFVHHEDVRRAAPAWEPRPTDVGLEGELWRRLRSGARIMARRSPVGLVLRRAGDGEVRARTGEPDVTVTGPASELVLFASGRQTHARVDIAAPDDVAARSGRPGWASDPTPPPVDVAGIDNCCRRLPRRRRGCSDVGSAAHAAYPGCFRAVFGEPGDIT
jgi:hypothetical protein